MQQASMDSRGARGRHATVSTYTVRYRCEDACGGTALIDEDEQRGAYAFCGGELQLMETEGNAGARLASLVGRVAPCMPVPEVSPYTLEGLRELAGKQVCALDHAGCGPNGPRRGYVVQPWPIRAGIGPSEPGTPGGGIRWRR